MKCDLHKFHKITRNSIESRVTVRDLAIHFTIIVIYPEMNDNTYKTLLVIKKFLFKNMYQNNKILLQYSKIDTEI